ncbi:tRNA pseudouridine(13) synthase TruD [Lysobacter fragariae]
MNDTQTLPRAHGDAVLAAQMRATPEDFLVEEIPAFEASGSGEHLLLTIEKRGMNTAYAAKLLAQWARIPEMGVSYAGLKDRHAVTRQRFTVHLPKKVAPDLAALESPELKVLEHAWHSRKLPRGALAGNRFELALRDARGDRDAIENRLQAIAERGVPNYFGEQRFGRDGDNVANALAMFAGRRVRREQRTIFLSAARSELFNRALAQRVRDRNWDQALEGEVWALDGSRSVFGPEPFNDELAKRLVDFDIHPTGPLWGRGELRTRAQVADIENAAAADDDAVALRNGLAAAGLEQERRALRLRPQDLAWSWLDDTSLQLRFALPPGAYATVVLMELGEIGASSRQ